MVFTPFLLMGENLDESKRDFIAGIGAITVAWAHVELALDMLVALNANLEGRAEERHPIPLQAKLDRLFRSLKQRQAHTKPYRGEFLQIISMCTTLAKKRHFMVHGALISTLSDQEITLMKVTKVGEEEDLERQTVKPHDMFVLLDLSVELIVHSYNLVFRILKDQFPEYAKQTAKLKLADVSKFHFPAINPRWLERQNRRDTNG